jgi:hypothetical protein
MSSFDVLLMAPLVDMNIPGGDSVHVGRVAKLLSSKHGCPVALVCKGSMPSHSSSESTAIIQTAIEHVMLVYKGLWKKLTRRFNHGDPAVHLDSEAKDAAELHPGDRAGSRVRRCK